MRLSLQVHYAICGVFDLAYNGAGAPVQVRVIGARQKIPARYLEQIFQRLRKSGIVCGKRGPGGGYTLARLPAEISLRDIVEAIEGPVGAAEDWPIGSVPERPDFLWTDLGERFGKALESVTLDDLCNQAAQRAVPREGAQTLTYQI